MSVRSWYSIGALVVLLLAGVASPSTAEATVVRAQARAEGFVSVVVALRAPAPAGDPRKQPARRAAMAQRRAAVMDALPADEVAVEHVFQTVSGFTARVSPEGLERLAANPDVLGVELDPVGTIAGETLSMVQIRADRVQARGVSGVGTTIAVIDTGVEASHPDIAGALVAEACFCRAGRIVDENRGPCCPDGTAASSGPGSANSADSHGPHVAGIALSRGQVAPTGVAPRAQLVVIRVLDQRNRGFLSDWVAALDWIAAERFDVRAVNMSLVSNTVYSGECGRACGGQPGCATNLLFADVIEQLWERGTMVFAASGNGMHERAMTSPACVDPAVSVGAVDGNDRVPVFSNSSPELDLLAPGVQILSDGVGGGMEIMSGTSMATPHVTGLAALLLSARPGLTPDALLDVLKTSGVSVRDDRNQRITPRVDALAALHAASQGAELERGGGSRGTDCLLEWSFVPPDIVQRRGKPLAVCRDNHPACDADEELGRCTFALSPCFNMRDPLLRACAVEEPIISFSVSSPPPDAPQGSLDRVNADFLAAALPTFPFAGTDTCSAPIPFVVARPGDARGLAHIRMSLSTATRHDYDHLVLECLPPS